MSEGCGKPLRDERKARNFRIMQAPIGAASQERPAWQDLVPHREDTFIEDFDVFDGFLALAVRAGGLAKISIAIWPADPASRAPKSFTGGPAGTIFFLERNRLKY